MENKTLKNLTIEEFRSNYFYVAELKAMAREVGISGISSLRKDQLEAVIEEYLIVRNNPKEKNNPAAKERGRKKIKNYPKDSETPLCLNRMVRRYTNDKITREFLVHEATRLNPEFKKHSGSMYWLNRWLDEKFQEEETITYKDVVEHYMKLNSKDHKNPRIPSTKFNNFISDYLKNEPNKSRKEAMKEWEKLKSLPIPKDYVSWKKIK